jgi:hypothetical protein
MTTLTNPLLIADLLANANDANLAKALGFISVKENLALQVREIDSTTAAARLTLDNRDAYVKIDTSGGVIALTMPYARTWTLDSKTRTPILVLYNTGAVNNVTLAAASGDTLAGATTVTPGEVLIFVTDGELTWTAISSNYGAPGDIYVNESGDTMTGPLVINSNLTVNGNTFLGDAAADTLVVAPNTVTWSNNPTHSGNHTYSSGQLMLNANPYGFKIVTSEGYDATVAMFGSSAYGGAATALGYYDGVTFTAHLHVSDDRAKFTVPVWGKGGAIGHHVEAYGAIGDGSTNDASAINSAIAAAKAGTNGSNTVVLGAKTYKITAALTAIALDNDTIVIKGEGCTGGTPSIISCASGVDGLVFTSDNAIDSADSNNQIIMRDFQILSLGGTATGLKIGTSGFQIDSDSKHSFENILVKDFSTNIHLLNLRNASFRNVIGLGRDKDVSRGLKIEAATSGADVFCGDISFYCCDFSTKQDSTSSVEAVRIENSTSGWFLANIEFDSCEFYYGENAGIYVLNSSTGTLSDVKIHNSQFDFGSAPTNSVGVYVHNTSTGTMRDVKVTNNYITGYYHAIACFNSGSVYGLGVMNNWCHSNIGSGVTLDDVSCSVVIGNQFRHSGNSGSGGDAVIDLQGACTGVTVIGNTHQADGATANPEWMVLLGASTTRCVATGNVGHLSGTEGTGGGTDGTSDGVDDNGTNNVVANNTHYT